MLHFGIHFVGQEATHLVHQLNIGPGRMVPIHWPWPKGEVSLINIKHHISRIMRCINGNISVNNISVRANFEFLEKLGVDMWCFHDRDIAPEGKTLEVSRLRLWKIEKKRFSLS